MVLAISITNRAVQFGFFKGDTCSTKFALAADHGRSADEYAVLISGSMNLHNICASDVEGAILSSVLPPLTDAVRRAVEQVANITPKEVGPGLKTGLNIKIENPAQLGSDLVAMTVGALSRYTAPMLLVNFEVATTVSVVDENGAFCGVVIAPGITESLSALSKNAANLPEISLDEPRDIVGKNTVEAMRSGAIYGGAAMLDGLVERLGTRFAEKPTVVVSGKDCGLILKHSHNTVCEDQMLVLDGLHQIYKRNQGGYEK